MLTLHRGAAELTNVWMPVLKLHVFISFGVVVVGYLKSNRSITACIIILLSNWVIHLCLFKSSPPSLWIFCSIWNALWDALGWFVSEMQTTNNLIDNCDQAFHTPGLLVLLYLLWASALWLHHQRQWSCITCYKIFMTYSLIMLTCLQFNPI